MKVFLGICGFGMWGFGFSPVSVKKNLKNIFGLFCKEKKRIWGKNFRLFSLGVINAFWVLGKGFW